MKKALDIEVRWARKDDGDAWLAMRQALQTAGITPRVALRANDIFSLSGLVRGNVGYALLPGRIAELYPGALAFQRYAGPSQYPSTLAFATWHRAPRTNPSVR